MSFLDGDPAALPVTEVRFSRESARLKNVFAVFALFRALVHTALALVCDTGDAEFRYVAVSFFICLSFISDLTLESQCSPDLLKP